MIILNIIWFLLQDFCWRGFEIRALQSTWLQSILFSLARITTEQRHGLQIRASELSLAPLRARRSQIRASEATLIHKKYFTFLAYIIIMFYF